MAGTLLVVVFAFAHLLTVALTYPGRIVSLRNEKIVGGSPAALGQYPYQVPTSFLSYTLISYPTIRQNNGPSTVVCNKRSCIFF
jgi:hypothetical protein